MEYDSNGKHYEVTQDYGPDTPLEIEAKKGLAMLREKYERLARPSEYIMLTERRLMELRRQYLEESQQYLDLIVLARSIRIPKITVRATPLQGA